MTPERKRIVNGVEVCEYYWAGDYPVYIGGRLSGMTFDGAVRMLEDRQAEALASRGITG